MTSADGASVLHLLRGKAVVLTGAGGGIGAALARGLGDLGATIFCLDLDSERVAAVAADVQLDGNRAVALGAVDLADHDGTQDALRAVMAHVDRIDAVVACAGGTGGNYVSFLEMSPAAWEQMITRNLTTAFSTASVFGGQLARQGGGSMVFVSSTAAHAVNHGLAHYAAAKAAVSQLARALALELGPHGVRVNVVAPGATRTPAAQEKLDEMAAQGAFDQVPLRRAAEPDELVGVVAYLASDAASYTTGTTVVVDGGATLCQ